MLTNLLLMSLLGLTISIILSFTWKLFLLILTIFLLLLIIKIYFQEKNILKLKNIPKFNGQSFPK